MAKNNKSENQEKQNSNSINIFDNLSKKILSTIDSSYNERELLNAKDARFQNIINREIDIPKGISNGNIVDFAVSQMTSGANIRDKNSKSLSADTNSVFTQNVGEVFNYFQDIYKNKYLEASDLKFISKFIPAVGEAVKVTLDSIVTSDDISSTITRNIQLSESLLLEDRTGIMAEIEKIEKQNKLLSKLKNIVYKKTLITGTFYVYAVSYKKLFEEYEKMKASGRLNPSAFGVNIKNTKVLKNTVDRGFNLNTESASVDSVIPVITSESFNDIIDRMANISDEDKKNKQSFIKNLNDHISTVSFVNSDIPILYEALESADSLNEYRKSFNNVEVTDKTFIDGTKGINSSSNTNFENTTGTYISYIDAKNIVPVKIFDQTIGYYHIHATSKKKRNTSIVGSNNALFSSVNYSEQRKEEVIQEITDSISQGILTNFSSKFVSDNSEHKKMIAECIIANGIIDNDYNIQFIPADQMIEFVINEDENGNGESILANSLFPGKLLLSLLICKMLNYMNKSGNRNIAHVFKGPIDTNSSNQLQRVVRMLQESNITFNDLLSTNLVFSKFSRDSNIQLPTARNGAKLVEFETQEGQQIDMKTEFENWLEDMTILGTGVPSVLMDYVNQIDYARQITSANIKWAGRTSSLQADLEDPTTKVYRILITNSDLNDDLKTKCLNNFAFKLPRPKALSNSNNSDFLRTALENANTISEILLGASSNNNPEDVKIKEELIRSIMKNEALILNWGELDEMLKVAKLKVEANKKINVEDSSTDEF